jgi:hypothetical protein
MRGGCLGFELSSRPSQRVRAKRGPMTGSARAGIQLFVCQGWIPDRAFSASGMTSHYISEGYFFTSIARRTRFTTSAGAP